MTTILLLVGGLCGIPFYLISTYGFFRLMRAGFAEDENKLLWLALLWPVHPFIIGLVSWLGGL